MVARRPPKAKAAGSIPVMGAIQQCIILFYFVPVSCFPLASFLRHFLITHVIDAKIFVNRNKSMHEKILAKSWH